MARVHGKSGVVVINGNTISGDVDNVDIPNNLDQGEVSGMGENRKRYIPGQLDVTPSMSGKFETGGTPAVHAVLSTLAANHAAGSPAVLFTFQPAGTASGLPVASGSVFVTSYQVSAPLSGPVTWSANLVPADSTGIVWSTN